MDTSAQDRDLDRKLGRMPFVRDSRDVMMAKYVDSHRILDSAAIPGALSWEAWPGPNGRLPARDTDALGNNIAGNCVLVGPGHMVRMVGALTGRSFNVTADTAIAEYTALTGYNPATGEDDNGATIRTMLKRWKSVGLYGTKIKAFARVNPNNIDEVIAASWLGCGLIGGFELPISAQGQMDAKGRQLWSVPSGGFPPAKGPGTWGGHCIWVHTASPKLFGGNSWGEPTFWDFPWQQECCPELWVGILEEWALRNGRCPNGFAYQDLLADVLARSA
jgi:hypothetical protein